MTHWVEWEDTNGHVRETDLMDADRAAHIAAEIVDSGRAATVYETPDPSEADSSWLLDGSAFL